jgi:hypothetical protein
MKATWDLIPQYQYFIAGKKNQELKALIYFGFKFQK